MESTSCPHILKMRHGYNATRRQATSWGGRPLKLCLTLALQRVQRTSFITCPSSIPIRTLLWPTSLSTSTLLAIRPASVQAPAHLTAFCRVATRSMISQVAHQAAQAAPAAPAAHSPRAALRVALQAQSCQFKSWTRPCQTTGGGVLLSISYPHWAPSVVERQSSYRA